MESSKKSFFGPWIIASCFVTFGLSTGFPYYNIAFFFDYFRDGHEWTQVLVTTGAPIAVLLTIWIGPVIVPKVSPRKLILIGTILTFLSFQWFGRLGGSEYEYYAAWCVYMAGYFLSGPIPHQIIISNWYKRRRGMAMGVTYVGVAVIGALCNRLSPYVTANTTDPSEAPGWLAFLLENFTSNTGSYTDALQLLSFLMVIVWPLAILVIRDKPEDKGQLADGATSDAELEAGTEAGPHGGQERAKSFGNLAGRSAFWLLLLGSAASIGSIAAVNFLMKFVYEEQGFTDQAARDRIWSDASFTYLMSSILGRLIAGWLADRLPRKYVMLVTYAIVAMAIPLLFLVTPEQPNMVYLFAIVFGFAMGADYMLIPLMAADQFGLASLGKAMSAILPSDTIMQFWTPRFVADLASRLSGYAQALWAVFGLAALGALAIAFLPRRSKD
jgi:MFS family permease